MKKYTIQEIKEQGIWVKCTGKDAIKLVSFFGGKKPLGTHNYYRYVPEIIYASAYSSIDLVSFVEFSQIIFPEDEKRKIIGYKAPFDMPVWGVVVDDFFELTSAFSSGLPIYQCKGKCMIAPEIVEKQFTPVYEEEEKIMVGEYEVMFDVEHKGYAKIRDIQYPKSFFSNAKISTNNNVYIGIRHVGELTEETLTKIIERLK